jgi:hypothetical protein
MTNHQPEIDSLSRSSFYPMDGRRTRILRALPWIGILLIIGTVQLIRDAPIDSVIFAVVAALIALDAVGALPQPPAVPARFAALAIGGAIAAMALAFAPRHGLLAGIVVTAVGIAAVAIAWSRPSTDTRGTSRLVLRGAILWASVTVLLCLWELSSFLLGRATEDAKNAHPAVSDLLDPAIDSWPGRIVFIAVWVAAMVGFVRAGQGRAGRHADVGSRP